MIAIEEIKENFISEIIGKSKSLYMKMEEEFKDCIDYKLEKKIVLPHGIRAIIYSYMTL